MFELSQGFPLTREWLVAYFHEGFKSPRDQMVGVEWEKIGLYEDSGLAIAYSGPHGVEAIFQALVSRYEWEPVFSHQNIIALKKGELSITLEPGGQVELSGRKWADLDQNADELFDHLREIKEVSRPMGIVWLGLGLQPFSALEDIEWVPKDRYAIMRERLKHTGALAHAMMKQTASIQISVDFTGEEDAVQKLRLAMGLAPILSAIYANSPVSEGRFNGFASKRCHIWSQTDPARTQILRRVFDSDFGIEDYVAYALGVPLLFIVRQGEWIPLREMTFGEYLEKGFGFHRATQGDWELHLTTLFTDARLKKYIELRSMDCQETALGLSVPALVKGLFYNKQSRESAWQLVSDLSWEERVQASHEAARRGLKGKWKNGTFLGPARTLVQWAQEGLPPSETKYLAPLKEMLNRGKSPAECLMENFGDELPKEEKIRRIIQHAAIC